MLKIETNKQTNKQTPKQPQTNKHTDKQTNQQTNNKTKQNKQIILHMVQVQFDMLKIKTNKQQNKTNR